MIDLMNKKMRHSKFGTGTVTEQNEKNITVQFAAKTCKFQYPSAFEKFLVAEDEMISRMIQKKMDELKAADELKKKKIEDEKKLEIQKKIEIARQSAGYAEQEKGERLQRIPGQAFTFMVSQGGSFDEECKAQFIWAPKYNKIGKSFHHWERLQDVRENDVIFHCSGGYILAISKAKGGCMDSERPCSNNLIGDEDWSHWEGRIVNCDYTVLKCPLKHGAFKDTIIQYCDGKYAPFNKMGTGNQGYLFELDKNLARFFINEIVKRNPEVKKLEYLQFLLRDSE